MGERCEPRRRRPNPAACIAPARGGLYRPRNPKASPLWRYAKRHGKELREAGRLRRTVEREVIERFIECGDPHHGFARIYCDACGHDYLLAYSCKTRYFCPSCHQKARAALRRVARGERARAGAAPAVRVHPAAAAAPDLRPASAVAGRAVPHRRALARRCVRRGGTLRPSRHDPVRADLRGSRELQPARACACRGRGVSCGRNVRRALTLGSSRAERRARGCRFRWQGGAPPRRWPHRRGARNAHRSAR
jgi:hypothetical protein